MTEEERRLLLITARILRNVLYDQMQVELGGDTWTQADCHELEAAIAAVDPPPAPPPAKDDDDIVF
jgi:hypothetical protein